MGEDGAIVFRVDADDKDAEKKLNQLRREIEKTAKAMENTSAKRNGIAESLKAARAEAGKTAAEIRELQELIAENEGVFSGRTGDVDLEEFNARKQAQAEMTLELQEQQKLLAAQEKNVARLEAQEEKVQATLQRQTEQLQQQKAEAGAVERVLAEQGAQAMPQLRAATDAVTSSMRKGIKNILKWGFGIRSAFILMRRLRSAVTEGVKAFAEQDAETRNNINGLKSSLNTLKLSWGAAFAPILNAVTPMLQKLISWLTAAANAVQMFFAILRGQSSYKRVIAGNEALADSYAGAGEAAKKAEKTLMSFDNINKLNAGDSGGGGGGGGGGAEQTEEVDVNPRLASFLQLCKEHLQEIFIITGLVGAALLGWKLSAALGTSFTKIFGILTTIIGAVVFIKNGFDAWENGVNWKNVTGMIEGAALAVIGLTIAFGPTAGAIAAVVAGIAMLVIGIKDWITTGELSNQTCTLIIAGLALLGIALAGVTGGWSLIAAAAIAAVLLIYKNWDGIVDFFGGIWESVKSTASGAWDKITSSLSSTWNGIKNTAATTWNGLKTTVSTGWSNIKTGTSTAWSSIKSSLSTTWGTIKSTASTTWGNLKSSISTDWDNIKTATSTAWGNIKSDLSSDWDSIKSTASTVWTNMKSDASTTWSNMKSTATSTWNNIKSSLSTTWGNMKSTASEKAGAIKSDMAEKWNSIKSNTVDKVTSMYTSIKTKFESIRSYISGKVQAIKNLFNFTWSFPSIKMPHFSWTWTDLGGIISIPNLSVDWYAKGGVFDSASLIGVGEAGKEAVMPLERNTGWIDSLADSLLDKMMSGNRFADYITGRPLPAFASGQIVPPRAVDHESFLSDSDITRLAKAIAAALGPDNGGGTHVHKWICDGRTLAEIVEDNADRMRRSRGR